MKINRTNRVGLRVPQRVRYALAPYIERRMASGLLADIATSLSFSEVAAYKLAGSYEGNSAALDLRVQKAVAAHAYAIGVDVNDLYYAAAMRLADAERPAPALE